MNAPSSHPGNRPGWHHITGVDYDAAWDTFYKAFHFRPSPDPAEWSAITEPSPSITFRFSHLTGSRLRTEALDINSETLRCLVWELPEVQRFLVLDWQHEAWSLDAALEVSPPPENREVGHPTVFPESEYSAYLTPDMTEGTFAHPWEQTICVIGERLVTTLGRTFETWLPVIRRNGRALQI